MKRIVISEWADTPVLGLSFSTTIINNQHYFILTMGDSLSYQAQMAIKSGAPFSMDGNTDDVIFRNKIADTWGSWYRVTTTKI